MNIAFQDSTMGFVHELKARLDQLYSQIGEVENGRGVLIYNEDIPEPFDSHEKFEEVIRLMGFEVSQRNVMTYVKKGDEHHVIVKVGNRGGVKILVDEDYTRHIASMG